jgi:hypothetical protein
MNQTLIPNDIGMCEVSVRLEHLDKRLKAIVRLRLREFIHLTPVFQSIPSIGYIGRNSQKSIPLRLDGEIFYDLGEEPETVMRPANCMDPSKVAYPRSRQHTTTI